MDISDILALTICHVDPYCQIFLYPVAFVHAKRYISMVYLVRIVREPKCLWYYRAVLYSSLLVSSGDPAAMMMLRGAQIADDLQLKIDALMKKVQIVLICGPGYVVPFCVATPDLRCIDSRRVHINTIACTICF